MFSQYRHSLYAEYGTMGGTKWRFLPRNRFPVLFFAQGTNESLCFVSLHSSNSNSNWLLVCGALLTTGLNLVSLGLQSDLQDNNQPSMQKFPHAISMVIMLIQQPMQIAYTVCSYYFVKMLNFILWSNEYGNILYSKQ